MTHALRDKLRSLVEEGVAKHGLRGLAREVGVDMGPVRTARDPGKEVHFSSALRILEGMGYEVAIRDKSQVNSEVTGFAEAAQAALEPSIDGSPEALRMGYLPIPFHLEDRAHEGAAPIAVARAWLRDQGWDIEALSFLVVPEGVGTSSAPAGSLALVHAQDKAPLDGRLFAMVHNRQLKVARLFRLSSGALLALPDLDPAAPPQELASENTRILGAVVWTGQLIGAE